MLLCLRVRNFAIIDELEVEFGPGMNVLTGETGAGKSILVSALKLVLGGKGRPEVVRTGAESAEVEAQFDIADDPQIRSRLEAAGLELEDELVLRRVVLKGGRTRAYVNGRLASAAQLAQLATGLADISSQHEHHTLVDPRCHLQFLDAYGGLDKLCAQVASAHGGLTTAARKLEAYSSNKRDRMEREDLLRYQIEEIEACDPQPGELDGLVRDRDVQRHAQHLAQVGGEAEEALYARDQALCEQLAQIQSRVQDAAELDPQLAPLAEQLQSAHVQLEDAARELGSYARGVTTDPARLAEVEERMEQLDRLVRKYGGNLEAVIEHHAGAVRELEALDTSEERLQALQAEYDQALAEATAAATKLSTKRRSIAKKLGTAISKELASLSMGDASVSVEVERSAPGDPMSSVDGARLTASGIDRVEFLIATNLGEAPQPLAKIASGGELSRAMLAVKRVLAGVGPGGLYVFDEVDSGVGGAVAEVIGRKIREVAKHHQVICITHLAQIAVFADSHYRVQKRVVKDRTLSDIIRLDAPTQKEEIARMLGGVEITDKTRAAAREMLRAAR